MSRVFVASDPHEPVSRDGFLEFCQQTYEEYDCDQTVITGDLVDWHGISFHAKHPESPGVSDEYELTKEKIQKWYQAFPEATICIGNHDERIIRLAESVDIPAKFLRNYSEIWDTPGWDWVFETIIDDVYYMHGTGFGGIHPSYNVAKQMGMSVVMGHVHSTAGIKWLVNPNKRWFGFDCGCVDADTEYLSETGWKRIGEYDGGKVAQYDTSTGGVTWVVPQRHIKLPCSQMYHFETKYGISQTLCKDHNILYIDRNGKLKKIKTPQFIKQHLSDSNGFRGKFPCFFYGGQKGIKFEESEIRLMVAVHADGTFPSESNNCYVTLKKQRKIDRLKMLLKKCGIDYKLVQYGDGTSRFKFHAPTNTKHYTDEWWSCSHQQLLTISDEVLHWDGTVVNGKKYTSTSKSDCDFIQYAFAATGNRTSIYLDDRECKCWVVSIAQTKSHPALASTSKCDINPVPSPDGFKYCFTMPKGTLVLRKDNCIFVTGNCGIDDKKYAFAYGRHMKKKSVLSCGVVIDGHPYHEMMPLEEYK